MFLALLTNELKTQFRRPSTHVFAAMYVAIGVLMMVLIGGSFEQVSVGLGGGNIHVDSPWTVLAMSQVMSLFVTMNIAAIAGGAACRDVEEGMHPLVYTTPVGKWTFLGARWLASLAVGGWIVAAIPIGLMFGALLPIVEPERLGSWALSSLVQTWVGWLLPNLVFTSALFFGLAALTRRMFPNYIGGVLLLVGYLGSTTLTADMDNDRVAALIDPFGLGAFEHQTRYSSPFEKNTDPVWPVGVALANRALWLAVGLSMLAGGIGLAKLDQDGWQPLRRFRRGAIGSPDHEPGRIVVEVPAVTRRFDARSRLLQLWALTTRAVRDVLGHRYFWAFVGAALLFQLLNSQVIGTLYGTETWPVTYQVIEVLESTLRIFLIVVLTFYAGDLVWHDRDLGTAPLFDSLPVPDTSPLVAKAVALFAIVVGMHSTVLVMGVLVQLFDGYTNFELGLYAQWLFGLSLLDWLPFVALALAVHVIVDNKVVGHLVLVGFYVARGFRGQVGLEYNLPWFGSEPGLEYSDMNGWGWFLRPYLVYKAYWIAVGVAWMAVAALLWVRGSDRDWRSRIAEGRRRLDRPAIAVLVGSLAVAAALAGWIGVNTSLVGTYRSTVDVTRTQVDYERRFKADWDGAPHPRITDVALEIDLYPSTGEARATGTLHLENREDVPISRILLGFDLDAEVVALTLDREVTEVLDASLPVRTWTLQEPLAPGERAALKFEIRRPDRGYPNQGANTTVVGNGSFVHSSLLLPSLGYERRVEVSEKASRRKYELPVRPRMRDLDDPTARGQNYISDDGDRVQLDVVVRTDLGQIALAPGALVDQGVEGDRAWYRYRTNRPILHFYSFLSGDWEVARDRWGEVAIEVYFDPQHRYNVDRMIAGVKASLEVFSEVYGPYQHGEVRIVEFPRYQQFAQSFPSTIPYSESIGFIARIADPDEDIDYPYYVTAHEVAHQWWAHQVVGADAQGTTVLSETLSQYSALIVMEREYGEGLIHRFLKYEADRYFEGRAFERDKELPLLRVEDQGYVHYRKGSVVMWALKQRVGEERLNASLRTFLERWRFAGPPYPTSRDLLAQLTADLPEAADVLRDGFERIVLYENEAESATVVANADGTWTVKLALKLAKTESDAVGDETDLPFSEGVEIGVFAGTESAREVLHLATHPLEGPTAEVEVVVDREPTLAGVDPNHLLLDRDRDDNVIAVVDR